MYRIARNAAALALAVAILPAPGRAGGPAQLGAETTGRIDVAMNAILSSSHAPGMSIAIARDGNTVYAGGYGFANLQTRAASTAATHYEIGSVTKQFTAAAILQLQERGKLAIADRLGRWVPEYPRAADVTLRELLQQTSGIPNFTETNHFVKRASTMAPSFDRILALIK